MGCISRVTTDRDTLSMDLHIFWELFRALYQIWREKVDNPTCLIIEYWNDKIPSQTFYFTMCLFQW